MTAPTYFTVVGDFKSIVADTVGDTDADPDSVSLLATVTFTPRINDGDLILATTASPRPTAFVAAPISGTVGSDGILKLRDAGSSGFPGLSYTPVRLLADTPLLELDGDLFYDVTFSNVSYNGRFITLNGFTFQAPTSDVTLNLVTVARAPGQPATAITKIAPTGVRFTGGNMVFSFSGVDIPEPLPLSSITGPQGPQGPQGIQGQAGVSLDINGTVSTYANLPSSAADGEAYVVAADGKLYYRFDGAWPADGEGVPFVGPQGPTGAQGIQGPSGTPGASGVPGEVGATGPVGATGASGASGGTGGTGLAGQSVSLKGSVASYSLLPGSATTGDGYIVLTDNLLYVWNGSWPAEGSGVPFVGPQGASGASGVPGASGASGVPGLDGASGTPGLDGASGAPGASGPPGATGPAGTSRNISTVTTPTTLGSTAQTDYLAFIGGASGTITLPGASGNENFYTVVNKHTSAVSVSASDTIAGLPSISVPENAAFTVVSDGSLWRIISSRNLPNYFQRGSSLAVSASVSGAGDVGVIASGWTFAGAFRGAATFGTSGSFRTVSSSTSSSVAWETRAWSTASNYSVTIKLSGMTNGAFGILIAPEDGSGKFYEYLINGSSIQVVNGDGIFNTLTVANTATQSGVSWLRFADNGTNHIFSYSTDGTSWTQQLSQSRTTHFSNNVTSLGWVMDRTGYTTGTASATLERWITA